MRSASLTNSRAQIPQLFIFIMALLVIGSTIFIGMKLLGGLQSTVCTANDASFQRSIAELLDERATYGLRDSAEVRAPCDAVMLCFVDDRSIGQDFASDDPVISSSVRAGVKTNVFLRDRKSTVPTAYDERIAIEPHGESPPLDDLCIPAVSGKFSFKTEGYGRYVIIRP